MVTRTKAFKYAILSSMLLIVYFVGESQLWTFDWISMLPIVFFVIAFFLIRIVKSVSFWISKNKDINYRWMPFLIQITAIVMICIIPSSNRNKRYYVGTTNLASIKQSDCNCHLYVEHYSVFQQGAWRTGLNAAYLTDSINFRKYLGVYDEGYGRVQIKCDMGAIKVEIIDSQEASREERNTYSLDELKTSHKFD